MQEEEPLVANKRKKVTELSCMEKASKCLNLKRPRVRSIAVAKHLQLYPAQASPQMLFDFSCDRKRSSARYQNFLSIINFIYKDLWFRRVFTRHNSLCTVFTNCKSTTTFVQCWTIRSQKFYAFQI